LHVDLIALLIPATIGYDVFDVNPKVIRGGERGGLGRRDDRSILQNKVRSGVLGFRG
jgi:hypothetical protein